MLLMIYGKIAFNRPFFVFEGNSLDIFQTIADIEKKIEAIDVLNNEYDIYDATGNILKFHVIQKKHRFLGLFTITLDTVQFSHSLASSKNELFKRMQQAYIALAEREIEDLDFDELANKLFTLLQFKEI